MQQLDKELGYLLLRLALGMNLLIHGVIRMGGNYQKFIDEESAQLSGSPLPDWSIDASLHAIPYVEAVIGVLLVIGLATRFISVVGGGLMICLMFGMGSIQKWTVVDGQMIYVLFYFILLFASDWNFYSMDRWLRTKAHTS